MDSSQHFFLFSKKSLINCSMVNDLLYNGIDLSNSIRIFLSIVKDVTYFLSLLDFLIRVETSPNQKRMSIYLIQQIEYVPL